MKATIFNAKIERLEEIVQEMVKKQDEFFNKALIKLSMSSKEFYSVEDAAEFLSLEPKYIHQLTFYKKIRYYKKKGQKKVYFKKEDLIEYLQGELIPTSEDIMSHNARKWKE